MTFFVFSFFLERPKKKRASSFSCIFANIPSSFVAFPAILLKFFFSFLFQLFEFADKYRGKYDSSITVAQKYYRSVSGYAVGDSYPSSMCSK